MKPTKSPRARIGVRRLVEKLARDRAELESLRRASSPPKLDNADELTRLAIATLHDAKALIQQGVYESDAAQFVELLKLRPECERTLALLENLQLSERPGALEDELRAGRLAALYSSSSAMSAYFEGDRSLGPLNARLKIASAALSAALAERGVAVVVAKPLTVTSGSLTIDRIDRRELRRIPSIRAIANRAADRLTRGEDLIIDCPGAGWRAPQGDRQPDAICWDRGSWLM